MTLVFRGVGLIVAGIVACLFPLSGAQAAGGRGKARALALLLRAMGPLAPLAGIALGIAGAVLIVMGLKQVPKAVSGSIASVLILIVLVCGGIGMTPTFSQLANSSSTNSGGTSSSSSSSWSNFFASTEAKAMLKVVDQYEAAVLQTLGQNPDRIPDSQVASKFNSLGSKLGKIDVSELPKRFPDRIQKPR